MKQTVRTSVTNPVTGKTKVYFASLSMLTIGEAVGKAIDTIEDSTPLCALPNKYQVQVELLSGDEAQ